MEFLNLLFGGGDGEIVFAVVGDVAAAAKCFGDLVHHLVEHVGLGLNAEVELSGRRKSFAESAEGDEDAAIFVAHSEAALGLFNDADNLKTGTVNHHIFANGVAFGKKHRGHIFAEHDDFFLVEVVAFANEATGEGGSVGIDEAKIGLHTAKIDGGNFTGFGADGVWDFPVAGDKRGNVFHRGAAFLEGAFVVKSEGFALAFLKRRRATVAALIPLGDESRVRAKLLHIFLDLRVEAGDESGDEHDDTDAKHDAKNREGAAEFVGAQRIHCLPEIFAICLWHKRA